MESNGKQFLKIIIFPVTFVLLLWIIKFIELTFNLNLSWFGIYPRTWYGLAGIVTSPVIHANVYHTLSNTIPLLILGVIIFYFYKDIAFQVFFWVYFITGLWVWTAARPAYHIGASGLVYGFVCFLFFSGIIRKDTRLMALSLLVTFVYGSLIWGILPLEIGISWESHLLGSLAGFTTAFYFRKEGPVAKKFDWENEPEDAPEEEMEIKPAEKPFKYIYINSNKKDNTDDISNCG